jgi:hypothetical protein
VAETDASKRIETIERRSGHRVREGVLSEATMMKSTWTTAGRMTFGIAALTAAGSLMWGGCSSNGDSYYCDDTGCYTCDGYGCSTVPTPSPPRCTGNTSCPSGSVCTDQGCQQTCTTTDQCPKGTVCKSGLCSAPTSDAGTPVECTTQKDCGPGKTCIESKCKDCGGTNGPCPCSTQTDCTNGDKCVSGTCTPPGDVCKFPSDCADGKTCADGQCVPQCSDTRPCATGTVCTKGVCKPDPTTGCKDDSTCPTAAPRCVSGICQPTCTADADCGDGNYCNQGVCAVDTRPKPNCTANGTECMTGQSCLDGFCKYACTTDAQCKVIDARIGYCGADQVCRTEGEAHPQCTDASQCATGQSCIDNLCK